mgnify:CR=1 FL=1
MSPIIFISLLHWSCVTPDQQPEQTAPLVPIPVGDLDDSSGAVAADEQCDDGLDNDLDGWIDGSDTDCPLAGTASASAADVFGGDSARAVIDVDGDGQKELLSKILVQEDYELTSATLVAMDWQGTALSMSLNILEVSPGHYDRDLTGDGVEDWVVGEGDAESGEYQLFEGPLVNFGSVSPYRTFQKDGVHFSNIIRMSDLDRDGGAELAVASYGEDGGIYLVSSTLSDGASIADEHLALLGPGVSGTFLGRELDIADLDGDGTDDLVALDDHWPDEYTTAGRLYVIPGTVTGDMLAEDGAVAILSGEHSQSILDFALPGDLNGDGYDDLLLASDGLGALLIDGPLRGEQDEDAFLAAAHTRYTPGPTTTVETYEGEAEQTGRAFDVDVVGDLDGDGRDDIAIRREDGVIFFVEAAGGMMDESDAYLLVEADHALQFAGSEDVDADGMLDIAFIGASQFWVFHGR